MATGMTDLAKMLRTLDATVRPGEYVFAVLPADHPAVRLAAATIAEQEGLTVVLVRADADRLGVSYDYVAAWITLTVHSSLAAVGLTAAVSAALAGAGISCNVLAAYHHDHLLVPSGERERASAVLRRLRDQAPVD